MGDSFLQYHLLPQLGAGKGRVGGFRFYSDSN